MSAKKVADGSFVTPDLIGDPSTLYRKPA